MTLSQGCNKVANSGSEPVDQGQEFPQLPSSRFCDDSCNVATAEQAKESPGSSEEENVTPESPNLVVLD